MKEKKYIIVSQKFQEAPSAACPLCGQIATDNRILAIKLYKWLNKWSRREQNYHSISVSLYMRNNKGLYDAILR